jgi:Alpha and gamma adaptin binding protein p34
MRNTILIPADIDPGWSRVIEALQTIMWPSMQMKPTRPNHRSQLSMERVKKSEIEGPSQSEMSKEPDAPPSGSGDPWPQPTATTTAFNRFDDDFADFVSAPSPGAKGESTVPSKETATAPAESSSSGPVVADDDNEEVAFHTTEDEDYKELLDDDMPSTNEILLTSQRIFGQSLAAPEEGEDDGEMGEFDLGSIMGALQSMKEEIAGMTNEEEKRKAAARVALGLVWGLEGGRGM